MEEFLHTLVAFLAAGGVVPPEVASADIDREKSYLQTLPDEPDSVWCFRIYDGIVPTLVHKQAGVYRVQLTVRDLSQRQALNRINDVWQFLIRRPELIEDIGNGYWAIFDARRVPIYAGPDEKGRHLYTLNFPVTTRMY